MFTWREIQKIVGFTDEMVSYRNTVAREVNFVLSPEFKEKKEDEKVAKQHKTNKNLRELARDRIKDPFEKTQVEVRLVEEALNPNPDFEAADFLIKYLDLYTEELGKDIYVDLRKEGTIYSRLINENKFDTSFDFLKYFPKMEAVVEFKFLLQKSVESEFYGGFLFLVKKLFTKPYKNLKGDKEIVNLLERESDKAESNKRIEDAELINKLLSDDERQNRIKAMKALLDRDFDKAVMYLKKIKSKEKLRDMIVDSYLEEIDRAKDDIKHFVSAYNLAYFGGLAKEEYKKYVEDPAGKLLEYYLKKSLASENEYQETVVYAENANPRDVRNILTRKFIALVEGNNASLAMKLKKLYDVKFIQGGYDEEEKVLEAFERLIETRGMFDIPKGEENLLAALDFAMIFDFGEYDIKKINSLLCKFYISEGKYEKASMYYIPDDKGLLDLIEKEVSEFINKKNYSRVYELINYLHVVFPNDVLERKKSELIGIMKEKNIIPNNLEKMIVTEDVFRLEVLPKDIYDMIFNYCFEREYSGAKMLIDLHIPLRRKAGSVMKIKIYRMINILKKKDFELSEKVYNIYKDIVPPTFLNWIVYFFNRLFKPE